MHKRQSKKIIPLAIGMFLSSEILSEFMVLECSSTNDWTDKVNLLYTLQIGTDSKKAIQVFKRSQLQMDFKETENYYELGQYTDETRSELIPRLPIDKESLMASKYNAPDDKPVSCKRK